MSVDTITLDPSQAGSFNVKIDVEEIEGGTQLTLALLNIPLTAVMGVNTFDLGIVLGPGQAIGYTVGEVDNFVNTVGRCLDVVLHIKANIRQIGQTVEEKHTPLARWRRARGGVLQKIAPARILCIGDSNTMGWRNNGGARDHRRARSYPAMLASLLASETPASSANFIGQGIKSTKASQYAIYDPRIRFGPGWGLSAPQSLGGNMFVNSTTRKALTFTPGVEWDTAEVWVAIGEASELTLQAGGVTARFTPTVGEIQRLVLSTGAVGAHALKIARVSGVVRVVGANVYNSARPEVCVLNAGRTGWRSSDGADATEFYSPLNAAAAVNADLILLELGLNDCRDSIDLATYEANMRAMIETYLSAGNDVALVVSFPPNLAAWPNYVRTQSNLAEEYGLSLFNTTARMKDFATAEADGFATDGLHLNEWGLADKAAMIKLGLVI